MDVNRTNLRAFSQTLTTAFSIALSGGAEAAFYKDFVKPIPGGSPEILAAYMTRIPALKKWEGSVKFVERVKSAFRMVCEKVASGFTVPRDDLKDDKHGLYTQDATSAGDVAAAAPDAQFAEFLKNSFTTALDYTGSAYFAANKSHVPGVKGTPTFTNKTTYKLTQSSLLWVIQKLRSLKDIEGEPYAPKPRKLVLVVSPDLMATAEKLIEAKQVNGTDNPTYKKCELRVWDRLTGTAWFVFDLGQSAKPFIFSETEKIRFVSQDNEEASDHVFEKEEFRYKIVGRLIFQAGLPQLAYGSTGEDAVPANLLPDDGIVVKTKEQV